MSSNSYDHDYLILKADFRIQPIVVTSKVENHSIVREETRVRIAPLDIARCLPVRFFDFAKP